MGVKVVHIVIFVSSVLRLGQPLELCRRNHVHKLDQLTCSDFDASKAKPPIVPIIEKLNFKNISGILNLTEIPFVDLKYMSIVNSKISDLVLGQLPNLVFLSLVKNKKLPDLSKDLFKTTSHIHWLSLVSNNHTITPTAFHSLKNLTWLHIQNQNFEHLNGQHLRKTLHLHELTIRNCQLKDVAVDAFDATSDLEILSLNFNKLKHFEIGTFRNLGKLKILELHHNKFIDFNLGQFYGLVSLEVLGLPSNFLKNVNYEELQETFPNLKKMEVKRRDLVDTNLKAFIGELRKKGLHIIGTPHDCHNHCNIV